MKELREDMRDGQAYLNPIYCMERSGARGSIEQIRQLAGMRGLMAAAPAAAPRAAHSSSSPRIRRG